VPKYKLAMNSRIFYVPSVSQIGKANPSSSIKTLLNDAIRLSRHLPILSLTALVPRHISGSYASCMSVSSSTIPLPRPSPAASPSKFLPVPPMTSVPCYNFNGTNPSTTQLMTAVFPWTVVNGEATLLALLNMLVMP
jgi:hypothetical protein